MKKRYDTILFDADGTLLDFQRSEREALVEALSSFGIFADEEMIATYSKINDGLWKALERKEIEKEVLKYRRFELLFEVYGFHCDAKEVAKAYMQALSEKGYPIIGAKELCEALFGRVRMYIVTNGVGFIQRERQKRSGLSSFFHGVFISEDVGYEKPDRRYFEAVASSIDGFSKESALIVGDSLSSDIRGGIGFGIDTCWYNPRGITAPEEMAKEITYTVQSFDEIKQLILQGDAQ
ncbi:MAG: YjjG family noncanonical pyrimidine nucleotidase [Clostridia bacterium]|nr:YjjG family noncanonical pyrimidine nucleotidase [Clostridia bacterium]